MHCLNLSVRLNSKLAINRQFGSSQHTLLFSFLVMIFFPSDCMSPSCTCFSHYCYVPISLACFNSAVVCELPRPYGLGLLVSSGILASSSRKYRYILLTSVSPTFHRESPFGQIYYTRKLYKPFARSHPLLAKWDFSSGVNTTTLFF